MSLPGEKNLVGLPRFTLLGRNETHAWLTWQIPHVRNDDDTFLSAPNITLRSVHSSGSCVLPGRVSRPHLRRIRGPSRNGFVSSG
jgi:hypothetical protein